MDHSRSRFQAANNNHDAITLTHRLRRYLGVHLHIGEEVDVKPICTWVGGEKDGALGRFVYKLCGLKKFNCLIFL
ncbi:unnamed protein product [Ilex paraguariensis]|uniref:Uncharacterized protein n=1 Tax=Ilex paraguariensis TaxID=185542 RepID=A0ABC8RQ79_9AQUA